MSKRKTPKPTVAALVSGSATVRAQFRRRRHRDAGLPELKKGDVSLNRPKVLELVQHKKSWLYAKIRMTFRFSKWIQAIWSPRIDQRRCSRPCATC